MASETIRQTRDAEQTKELILVAASHEFSEKGFHGTNLSIIAQRAKVSKQLLHYHFRSKEALLEAVHEKKLRPNMQWQDTIAEDPAELIVRSFLRRASEADYIRYLTWEAASGRNGVLPRGRIRKERIDGYGAEVRRLQADGVLAKDLDPQMLHLAILCLSTYPLAFAQVTHMVTDLRPEDPKFQQRWMTFLRAIGSRLAAGPPPAPKPKRQAAKPIAGKKAKR